MNATLLLRDASTPLGAPSTAPPEFVSGFGTLIGKERELQAQVRAFIAQADGPDAPNLARILGRHDQLIGAIIGLLEQREDQLPDPLRFQALHSRATMPTHAQPQREAARAVTLPGLIAFHFSLVDGIEALIKAGKRPREDEALLTEAVQRQEDLAWMLRALQSEDQTRGAVRPESGWENEGGAFLPGAH